MVETLYTLSCGIIDQLIGIYMYMTIDYLKAEKKPVVDKEYIKKIVDKQQINVRVQNVHQKEWMINIFR